MYEVKISVKDNSMDMVELLTVVFKTFLGYLTLILIMRFMGKREIGQLNLFDLVILLTIVDLLVVGIENYDKSFLLWIVPIVLLGVIQKCLALLLLKCSFFRTFIDGRESLIINKGEVVLKNMKKNNYNLDDLFLQLRLKGVKSIEEVEYAVLEANGELSVFPKSESNGYFPIPLLISGSINVDALKAINKNKNWLISSLREHGYNDYKKVKLVLYLYDNIKIVDDYK